MTAHPTRRTRPVAVLIGPPAAGKSVVGAALADRLGVPFADSDDLVAAHAGCPAACLIRDGGESAFRDLERDVVGRALDTHHGVLALGGGAPLDDRTHDRLAGHRVVLLTVGHGTAMRRLGPPGTRPLLDGPHASDRYDRLLEQRMPVYRAASTEVVATDHLAPGTIADLVAARLGAVPIGEPT